MIVYVNKFFSIFPHLQDGLFLMTQDPGLITGYDLAILTPNVMEFGRLYEKVVRN